MANPILRGDDNPQLQKQTYNYDWQRGGTYSEDWKGINPDKMITKWNGQVATVQRAQMSIGMGLAELRLEWAGSSSGTGNSSSLAVTIDRWECPEPTTIKDAFQHPAFLAYLLTTGANYGQLMNIVSTIRRFAENAKSAGQSLSNENDLLNVLSAYCTSIGLTMPVNNEPWLYFYRLYINGQDHYQTSLYSVRHTTNCPNYWSRNVADNNVNCIYSQAQLMGELTDATVWYLPLPGRLQYKLNLAASNFSASAPVPATLLGAFQIGWLKGASGESTIHGGRIEISTNYVLDQWSKSFNGLAV